ncbi:MAG: transposase family protein, partial [Chloroflexota bacterium]|nr:transposase family protein [Chloroflexota bacterium]
MGNCNDTTNAATLVSYLARISDPRSKRGRRYEWTFLLALIVFAMMSGESTLVASRGQPVAARPPRRVAELSAQQTGYVAELGDVRCATAHQTGSGTITHLVAVVGHEHGNLRKMFMLLSR